MRYIRKGNKGEKVMGARERERSNRGYFGGEREGEVQGGIWEGGTDEEREKLKRRGRGSV